MVMGMDPEQAARVKALTQNIKAEILVDPNTSKITISFATISQDANVVKAKDEILDTLPSGLAQQLSAFFGIQGTIRKIKKK